MQCVRRCSTCVQKVGGVGTYLLCRSIYIYIYVYVRTSAVQYVRISVRTTYCTAVGIARARAVGTVVGTVGT